MPVQSDDTTLLEETCRGVAIIIFRTVRAQVAHFPPLSVLFYSLIYFFRY